MTANTWPGLSTPDVWVVSRSDFTHRIADVLAFAEAGGYVLVRDGRAHGREFWLSAQPPAWWQSWGMDDSAQHSAQLRATSRRRLALARAARWGSHDN